MEDAQQKVETLLQAYRIDREMPANYKEGELDFCRKEFTYSTFDVKTINYRNAIVNGRGFLYRDNFHIVNESLVYPPHYQHLFTFKHYVKKVFLKAKSKLDEDCLLCFDDWGHHHYHWFCDTLPRIYAIRAQLQNYTLLLPDFQYVHDVGLKTLALLDLKPKKVYFVKTNEMVRVKSLTLVTQTALSGYINDRILSQIATSFAEIKPAATAKPRKLYISRKGARYRKVLNEDAVIEVVQSFGYEVISYDGMGLEEQIAITSDCTHLVSIHGAGLTNMIYMPKGASVLEFRRDRIYHNQCYWHLAKALQLQYFYYFGKPDHEDLVIEGDGCNLTIDVTKLAALLKEME